jgi:hypothetical protein
METELRELIARVRRRWFRLVALRTVARATASAALPIVVALAIDGALRPQGWALILLGSAALVATLAAAGAAVLRMQRRPDDRVVARYIEERARAVPGGRPLDDELVSAVDVADGRNTSGSPGFTALILAAAIRHLRTIDPAAVIAPEALKRTGVDALAGTLALVVVLGLGAPSIGRVADTAWMAAFPDSIHVDVLPGDAKVLA